MAFFHELSSLCPCLHGQTSPKGTLHPRPDRDDEAVRPRNGWKVAGHFVDRGESARTANRPELKRLIQHCRENKGVDVVLVHKIDRLARNLIDYATIKAILKQKGIRLVSVSEPFDDNSIGHLLENIIASISEWYSANLGDEIRKANAAKLKRGEWPHKPPVGYTERQGRKRPGRTRARRNHGAAGQTGV